MEEFYQEIISRRKAKLEEERKKLEEEKHKLLSNIKEQLIEEKEYYVDLQWRGHDFRKLLLEILDEMIKFDPEEKKYRIIGITSSQGDLPYSQCKIISNFTAINIFLNE
jgi:hypothetical protein